MAHGLAGVPTPRVNTKMAARPLPRAFWALFVPGTTRVPSG